MKSVRTFPCRFISCLLLGAIPLAGCHSGGGGGGGSAAQAQPGPLLATGLITAAGGGTVTVPAPHPMAGSSITIPPGALAADTEISIHEAAGPAIAGILGQALDIEPDGTLFGVPATVTLIYPDAAIPAGVLESQLKVVKVLAGGVLFTLPGRTLNAAANQVAGATGTLSVYGLAADEKVNRQPESLAGLDQRIQAGAAVFLDGSASSDADGDRLTYHWTLVASPAGSQAALAGADAAFATFTADLPGDYEAELTVSDGLLPGLPDRVRISTENNPPAADAGPDQAIGAGETVTLDAGASSDADGDLLEFSWSLVAMPAGSAAALSDPASPRPSFIADLAGEYVARLTVRDGRLESAPDEILLSTGNVPPVAAAGPNRTVQPGGPVAFDAGASTDANGDLLTFAWSLLSRPAGSAAAFADPAALRPVLPIDQPGSYIVQLVASDGRAAGAPDIAVVTTAGGAPEASAGPDRKIQAGEPVVLDGGGSSDPDGDALQFRWALLARPAGSQAVLEETGTVSPRLVPDLPGYYAVQLIAGDSARSSVPDTAVLSTDNSRPSAVAGADRSIFVNEPAVLDGAASSDPDGDALTYSWALLRRPAGSQASLVDANGPRPSLTADRAGDYLVQLAVRDGSLTGVPDTVLLSTANRPPRADAGPDQGIAAGSLVQLDGSASADPDRDALVFQWTLIEKPAGSAAALSDAGAARPTFTADRTGAYRARLVVGDGALFSDPDEVSIITVNRAPIARAGADQSVRQGDVVHLAGGASSDTDGDALTYRWTLTAPQGSAAALSDAAAADPIFAADLAGSYEAQLVVNDGALDSQPDAVLITARMFVDADQDGWEDALDCNPADPLIHPGAAELCGDAIDSDCSGNPDDKDRDGDGFIDAACGGNDADDDNPAINPRGTEVCNDGVDNNNNGLVDGDDPTCAPGCDADGDGHPAVICGGLDADDGDPSVHPGAQEICDDFTDNDQDGFIDEACHPDSIVFGPTGTTLLSGDRRSFKVLHYFPAEVQWIFQVNGTAGGGSGLGSILATPGDPTVAIFTAPPVAAKMVFTLTAIDPEIDSRRASMEVQVVPVAGTFTIQPANVFIGLGVPKQFHAAIDIAGIGLIPLSSVFWKVNGKVQGDAVIGRIQPTGLYKAPAVMPLALPLALSVGFSLSKDGPVLATAPLKLAELTVAPATFTSTAAGPAGQLTASLRDNNNVVAAVPAAALKFHSDAPQTARIDGNGNVAIGDNVGRAILRATHIATQARDTALAFSRSDIRLEIDAVHRTLDYSSIQRGPQGVTEIEFTRPGVLFNISPRATILRGQQAGTVISDFSNAVLSLQGDGVNVIDYDADGAVPQPQGTVAIVERKSGLVLLGSRPGTGTVTLTYDDGFVNHSVVMKITFSRLDLAKSAKGSITLNTSDVYVTEYIDFIFILTNPNPLSDFIGEAPIEITLPGNESFQAAYGLNINSGMANGDVPFNSFVTTDRLVLTVPSNFDPLHFGNFNSTRALFKVAPRRQGEHRFRIRVLNDSGIPPQEAVFQVKRPEASLIDCNRRSLNHPAWILANSGVGLSPTSPANITRVSIFDLYISSSVFGFAAADTPYWSITGPAAGETRQIPVTRASQGFLQGVLREPGDYKFFIGLGGNPEIRSQEVSVQAIVPGGTFAELAAAVKQTIIDPRSGQEIPPGRQLGAIHIESPVQGAWVPGVPIPVRLRCYRADGTPGPVGKTLRQTFKTEQQTTVTTNHFVYGVNVINSSGASIERIDGDFLPGPSGEINFTIFPSASPPNPASQLAVLITPVIKGPEEFAGLPLETEVHEVNGTVSFAPNPFGLVKFADPNLDYLTTPCLYIDEANFAFDPRQIAVPNRRVRDAVQAGRLPAGADRIHFTAVGARRFTGDLSGGIDFADLGTGLIYEEGRVVDGKALISAAVLTELFESGAASYGQRQISLHLRNGALWKGEIELFRITLDKPVDHADKNLPLNAQHHKAHVAGSQAFLAQSQPNSLQVVELELKPSLLPGQSFRGASVDQPLVAFKRDLDPDTGWEAMSALKMNLFNTHNQFFLVLGNRSDRRRLDPFSTILGPEGEGDRLPDFVSPAADAESLVAGLRGNIADVLFFTAYNLVAKMEEQPHAPSEDPFHFDSLKGSAEDIYDRYSIPERASTNDFIAAHQGRRMFVHVDHEAAPSNFHDFENRLLTSIPESYFAGMLDQYYLWEGLPSQTLLFDVHILGQDGRVRAFDGDRGKNLFGGASGLVRDRRAFGVELDAVLYDPNILGLDASPNGADLINLPVVTRVVAPQLTASHLLPEQGGTSGGYYDLDVQAPGSHFVLAKTPGQEFSGLNAGYLVRGKPEDLIDPYTEAVEDDFGDIALTRIVPSGGEAAGSPMDRNRGFTDLIWTQRDLMTYSSAYDQKDPITTGFKVLNKYRITTDPEGLPSFEVKAGLLVRERPPENLEESINLIATSQSDGNEGGIKVVIDTLTDLAVDVVSSVLLTALTEGSWLEACGGEVASNIPGAIINLGVGLVESELIQEHFEFDESKIKQLQFANGVLQDGKEIPGTEGTSVYFTLKDAVSDVLPQKEDPDVPALIKKARKRLQGTKLEGGLLKLGICGFLNAPFEKLKDAIKNSFTAADLGGNGAAQAAGLKVLGVSIPRSAQRDEGVHNFQFSISRKVDIAPKEPFNRELSALTTEFNLDPAEVSDIDLIRKLFDRAGDNLATEPAREEARTLLRRMAVQSVTRDPRPFDRHDHVYTDYKLRFARMPTLDAFLIPGGRLDDGTKVGDFVLKTNETKIPVTAASMVTAARTNPNAGARAAIRCEGYDVILLKAIILSPPR